MADVSHTQPIDLTDKSILVTGGTGSFGQQFIQTILRDHQPRRVVIYSRDEHKQYDMAQTFRDDQDRLRFFIGDVRDRDRLAMAMRGVDIIVHAAALKHVSIAEYNPFECINTNVMGAENIVYAAIQNEVKQVLALSTDKAANPINLYGASKLASDKIMVAGNSLSGASGTRFAVVRYGNVIGSRGSIVPLFRSLIEGGATNLPITDPRMTRFWITLQQGVEFVLSSLRLMRGGEVFVPKIPSMNIMDLAQAMAPDLECKIVGIRPGEKLHEVLISEDDARNTLELDDRYIIEPAFAHWERGPELAAQTHPVAEDFRFASDTNPDWLDAAGLQAMLESAGLGGASSAARAAS